MHLALGSIILEAVGNIRETSMVQEWESNLQIKMVKGLIIPLMKYGFRALRMWRKLIKSQNLGDK